MDWPTLLDQLIDRFGNAESPEIELKSAQGGIPKSLWPTVSAFANSDGGWILLGVREEQGSPVFEGIKNVGARIDELFGLVNDRNKISYPAFGKGDVAQIELGPDSERVILVRVPAAPRKQRPVYLHGNPLNRFLRFHSSDIRCDERDVRRMMREASDESSDDRVLEGVGLEDMDREAIRRFRQRFQNRNPADVWNDLDDLRFLRAIGAWGRHKPSGHEGVTVAGLLMFGQVEAIREWRHRHIIDFRRLPSFPTADNRWDDRVVWNGHLWGAFETIYPRLVAELPVPFRMEGAMRIDESPAHRALREALVNLLVHADYAEPTASLIQRSPEGFLFRNPGASRLSIEDLYRGDRSDPRNPRLVDMFRYVGFAEDAGKGLPTILAFWHDLGYRRPWIEVPSERYEFAIHLTYAHLVSDADRQWLAALGEGLSEAQQIALVLARQGESLTNAKICQMTGMHPADVTKELRNLRSRQLLDMDNMGRWASYRLSELAAVASEVQRAGTAQEATTQLSLVGVARDHFQDPDSLNRLEATPTNYPNAAGATPIHSMQEGDNLDAIAEPARRSRSIRTAELDSMIVRLCSVRPLSIGEISDLTRRTTSRISPRLTALVRAGRLRLVYPDRPTHPGQRYESIGHGGE